MALETTRRRLVLSLLGFVVSVGVLAFNLSGVLGDEDVFYAGERPARAGGERATDPEGPVGRVTTALDDLKQALAPARELPGNTSETPGDVEPAGVLSAQQPTGPDWTELFKSLMERDQFATSGAGFDGRTSRAAALGSAGGPGSVDSDSDLEGRLDESSGALGDPRDELQGLQLRGLLNAPNGGLALLGGHVLRAGDGVPGTGFRIARIGRDRLQLTHPRLERALDLMLAPLSATSGGVPSGAGVGGAARSTAESPNGAITVEAAVVAPSDDADAAASASDVTPPTDGGSNAASQDSSNG